MKKLTFLKSIFFTLGDVNILAQILKSFIYISKTKFSLKNRLEKCR